MLESRRRIELTEIHAESNSKLLDPCEQLLERERERVGFSKDRDEERESACVAEGSKNTWPWINEPGIYQLEEFQGKLEKVMQFVFVIVN